MPFNPVDFYAQASEWFLRDPSDVRSVTARSIVSRAYYAALLVARDKANVPSVGATTHYDTVRYFLSKRDKISLGVGNRLDVLRLKRNDADYDCARACVRRDAGEALQAAQKILEALGVQPPAGGARGQ